MKRLVMIFNGEVANVIMWDGIQCLDFPGYELVDITDMPHVGMGWKYEGGNFLNPNEQ